MMKELKIILLFILMAMGLMIMAGGVMRGIIGSTLFFGGAWMIYKIEQGKSE